MAEKSVFIPDDEPNMAVDKRNMQLSSELAAGANRTRNITKIVRGEVDGKKGWIIYYEA